MHFDDPNYKELIDATYDEESVLSAHTDTGEEIIELGFIVDWTIYVE